MSPLPPKIPGFILFAILRTLFKGSINAIGVCKIICSNSKNSLFLHYCELLQHC